MNFAPALRYSGMRGRMSMSGLGQFDEGTGAVDIGAQGSVLPSTSGPVSTTAPSTSGVIASAPGATGGFDWSGMLSTAAKAVTTFGVAKLQATTQQQQIAAQAQTQQAAIAAQQNPYAYSISPSYLTGQVSAMPAWLPIVAIGGLVGAYFLMRK